MRRPHLRPHLLLLLLVMLMLQLSPSLYNGGLLLRGRSGGHRAGRASKAGREGSWEGGGGVVDDVHGLLVEKLANPSTNTLDVVAFLEGKVGPQEAKKMCFKCPRLLDADVSALKPSFDFRECSSSIPWK